MFRAKWQKLGWLFSTPVRTKVDCAVCRQRCRRQKISIIGGLYKVDGFLQEKIVYEFLGCYFYGCPKCMCPTAKSISVGMQMDDLSTSTMNRLGKASKLIFFRHSTVAEKTHKVQRPPLYSYINKNGTYPVGHTVITQNLIMGLMYCKILPQQEFYNPVLPQRIRQEGAMAEKLVFTLCLHLCRSLFCSEQKRAR